MHGARWTLRPEAEASVTPERWRTRECGALGPPGTVTRPWSPQSDAEQPPWGRSRKREGGPRPAGPRDSWWHFAHFAPPPAVQTPQFPLFLGRACVQLVGATARPAHLTGSGLRAPRPGRGGCSPAARRRRAQEPAARRGGRAELEGPPPRCFMGTPLPLGNRNDPEIRCTTM